MKKKIITFSIAVCLLFSIALPVFAQNKVATIDISAVVNEDGSVYITQVWEGDFNEGTENFIPMNAPDYLKISGLQVTDINGTYETVDKWNVDGSFEQKANKCGLNYTDNGYEICFGISEYGHNRYAIEYKLDGAVGAYTDMDGMNFRFVNDKMNSTPTDVKVEIRLANGTAITDDISDIWAFGFEGEVGFSDGAILAYTKTPITADNHVTVMFSLNKNVISPQRKVNDSFETVKTKAFDGSDYDNSDDGSEIWGLIFLLVVGVGTFVTIIFVKKAKKKMEQKKIEEFAEGFGYFRDIPNDGNTNATYELGRLFEICEDGSILATGMLRLIDLGCLEPISQEKTGIMGKTKETVNLKLMGSNGTLNEFDEYLYTVLEGAAGADGVLQPKELEKFADAHDTLLRNYIIKCEEAGKQYLNQRHCVNRYEIPLKLKYLTPTGEKELGEMMGFKKYLEDFSLIAERGVKEMPIWKELLSYAMLFGIADKVSEQLKAMYPNITTEVISYSQSVYTAYSYHYLLYRNMRSAEERREQEKRSSGSGGFSSMGGGGGSVGGGSGGGSR